MHRGPLLLAAVLAALALWSRPAAAQAPPETIEYYGTDALGSIRVVFDPQGNVLGRSDYLPFGDSLQPSGNLPRQRFTGQERDGEAGMDYFNARSMLLRTGRFNGPDPLFSGAVENPQGWNVYEYAANNPMRFADPTGMAPFEKDTRFSQIDGGQEEGLLSAGAGGIRPSYMPLDASGHGMWAATWTDLSHAYLEDQKARSESATQARKSNPLVTDGTAEVEVLTSAPAPGAHSRSAFGHTAISIGGTTYSFTENGWVVISTAEYLAKQQAFRDTVGQVLDLSPMQVAAVVDALNQQRALNTAYSTLKGITCVFMVQNTLRQAVPERMWSMPGGPLNAGFPGTLSNTLSAAGYVGRTTYYPKK